MLKTQEPSALGFRRLHSARCGTAPARRPRGSEHRRGPVLTRPLPQEQRGAVQQSRSAPNTCSRFAVLSRDKELRTGGTPAALPRLCYPLSRAAGAPSLPRGLTQRSRGKEGSKRQPGQELLNAASSALNPVLPPPAAAVEGMTQRQRAQRTENNPSRSLSESPWPVTFSPAEGRGGRSDLPVSGMFGSQR